MGLSRIAIAGVLVTACTNGDGVERPPAPPEVVPERVPAIERAAAPTTTNWGWATRATANGDRVLGLAIAGDGSTVLLTSEGIGWRSEGVVLSRHDVTGALVYSRELSLRAGPEGRALVLRGDRIEVVDPAMHDDVPALKIAIHALEDGSWIEDRVWKARGEFSVTEMHALPGGDTVIAGFARWIEAAEFAIGDRGGETEGFVARVAGDGTTAWLTGLTGRTRGWLTETITAVAATPTGVLVAGGCEGKAFGEHGSERPRLDCSATGEDAFVARWSLHGELEWMNAIHVRSARQRESTEVEVAAIAPTVAGGAIVVGDFAGDLRLGRGASTIDLHSRGGFDAFLAHYDRDGELLGAWSVGDRGIDRFVDVAVDAQGDAWLVGVLHGHDALTIDLGARAKPRPVSAGEDALPRFGVLVRVDLERKAAASLPGRFVAAQGQFSGPSDGVTPERVVVAGDHVRVAGNYGGKVELPILDGSVATLELRDPEGIDDEIFVWASARRMPSR